MIPLCEKCSNVNAKGKIDQDFAKEGKEEERGKKREGKKGEGKERR
jgi:hypothetical protein